MKSLIFDIKRYAIHDGPGIRTTIFFKGCPLNCLWCHNPESQDVKSVITLKKCQLDGVEISDKDIIGKIYSVDELMREIEKDLLFFDESGGGVTFSGGEPLMQYEFLTEILKLCKEKEIHTTLDTTGFTSKKIIQEVAKYTDLFLFDLKHLDDNEHIKYTGVSNKTILRNLDFLLSKNANIIVRFPLIPGINDTESNIANMQNFMCERLMIKAIEVLPCHNLANHKYEKIKMKNQLKHLKEPTNEYVEQIKNKFKFINKK